MVAATAATLHLIEPLGFDLSEPKLKRAGLDYHDLAEVRRHPNLEAALASAELKNSRVFAFTAHASDWYTNQEFTDGDVFLFGPEPTGLSDEVLAHPRITQQVRIPMMPGRRSLNLSNSAAVVSYEAWRQQGFPGAR